MADDHRPLYLAIKSAIREGRPTSVYDIHPMTDAVMPVVLAALAENRAEVLREWRRTVLAALLKGPVDEASAANEVWAHGYKAGLSVAADLTFTPTPAPAPSDPGSGE